MKSKLPRFSFVLLAPFLISGCYFYEYLKNGNEATSVSSQDLTDELLGESLGAKAGGAIDSALQTIYGLTSEYPPAAIRPDPDEYARSILRQYREEGTTIAQNIARLEDYRLLLGGGPITTIQPKTDFDSTALLANIKITESVCEALLDPNDADHGDWQTIVPYAPSDSSKVLSFLIQRFLGVPESQIDATMLADAKSILDSYHTSGPYSYASYVPVCTTLASAAEGLML